MNDHNRAPRIEDGSCDANDMQEYPIAVVIPSYKVRAHILKVIERIPKLVWRIYVIDDACPEKSGHFVQEHCNDQRIKVIFHERNKGVGGAVITGYRHAIEEGAALIVKIDGDGQMDPSLIPIFAKPIISGEADYTKGNRFFELDTLDGMPRMRVFGNAALSLMSKLSTGYWDTFDPTNGYTCIHGATLSMLPLDKISERYFFETDILFRLGTVKARVIDIPMRAIYGDEESGLKIKSIMFEFLRKHLSNSFKRIFYNYFLREMSVASFELVAGILLSIIGTIFGIYHWIDAARSHVAAATGTVVLTALMLLAGLQMLLAFVAYDTSRVPNLALHRRLHFPPDLEEHSND